MTNSPRYQRLSSRPESVEHAAAVLENQSELPNKEGRTPCCCGLFTLVVLFLSVPSIVSAQDDLLDLLIFGPGAENIGFATIGQSSAPDALDQTFNTIDSGVDPKSFGDSSKDDPDRLLGSAFFGGRGDPKIFAPTMPEPGKQAPKWPDISEPGPDMGDFPNSAYTLPKGRWYLEVAPVTLLKGDSQNPDAYAAPFLMRYGLTDNVEFRVFGHGLTSVGGSSPSTGFSPLNFDLKVHLWNDRKEWLIPAVSLEAYVLTQTGSPQFNAGIEPSINLNFDLPITKKLKLEWTVGRSGVQEAVNTSTLQHFIPRFNYLVPGLHRQLDPSFEQFSASWAIEYEISDRVEVFVHGFHNGAVLLNIGSGDMVGAGMFLNISPRLTLFGSLNSGLTVDLPPIAGQLGFAVAL